MSPHTDRYSTEETPATRLNASITESESITRMIDGEMQKAVRMRALRGM